MKRTKNFIIITIMGALAMLITACSPTQDKIQEPTDTQSNSVGLANPAAVYCEGLGYTMESVERNGGEDADCVFSDSSRCAQWDFLAGRCGQSFSYCEQQGGVLDEGGNVGVCRFSDGSYCDEYAFFTGECMMGDNLADSSSAATIDDGYPVETETPLGDSVIQSFDDAFNFMLQYMKDEYNIEASEAWTETDITTENATATTTHRYVSGSLTMVISAMASAPNTNYVINEVSDLTSGFFWRGSLSYDAVVVTDEINLPATVRSVEDAREAVTAYLTQTYGMPALQDWSDEGSNQGSINERPTSVRTFSANTWSVIVEFEPATPLVGLYYMTVEDQSGSFKWEGTINLYGKIIEGTYIP